MTHREDVVVVVGELLLGEKLQVLGLRVEAKAGLHLVAFFLFQRASHREERKLFRVFSFLVFFFDAHPLAARWTLLSTVRSSVLRCVLDELTRVSVRAQVVRPSYRNRV